MAAVIADTAKPSESIRTLIDRYVSFSMTNNGLVGTLIGDIDHLDEVTRRDTRQLQDLYISQWGELVIAATHVGHTAAEVRVWAALTMIHDAVQTLHLRALPNVAGTLRSIGHSLLLASPRRLG